MRLLIAIPAGTGYYKRHHALGQFMSYEREVKLETTVHKIIGPPKRYGGLPHAVFVHAYIPTIYREQMDERDLRWVTAELFRARAYLHDNEQSLRAFIASGDKEWTIQEAS